MPDNIVSTRLVVAAQGTGYGFCFGLERKRIWV
jgi:hypothetical protein